MFCTIFSMFISLSVSSGHCGTRPLHRLCWHEVSASRQVRLETSVTSTKQPTNTCYEIMKTNMMGLSDQTELIHRPSFVLVSQGETGGERSATEYSTHGVWHCKYWFLTSETFFCGGHTGHRPREVIEVVVLTLKLKPPLMLYKILPGVRVIIVNPETRGPLGDSHLGEVRGQRG